MGEHERNAGELKEDAVVERRSTTHVLPKHSCWDVKADHILRNRNAFLET